MLAVIVFIHTHKIHQRDIWACRSEQCILTLLAAVRIHWDRCQESQWFPPRCKAFLVHITLADHPRRCAQQRAMAPLSGSMLPEPFLWRKMKPLRGVQTSQAHMDPRIQPQSHPLSAVVLDPDAMNSAETQRGANPQGSHIHTHRELSATRL